MTEIYFSSGAKVSQGGTHFDNALVYGHVRNAHGLADLALSLASHDHLQNLLADLVHTILEPFHVCPDNGGCLGVLGSVSAARLQEARRVALAVADLPVIRRAVFGVRVVNGRDACPCGIVDDGHKLQGALALCRSPLVGGGQLVKVAQLVKDADARLRNELVKIMGKHPNAGTSENCR